MEVIISANQAVLNFVRTTPEMLPQDMTKEEYLKWIEGVERDNTYAEQIQKVTV